MFESRFQSFEIRGGPSHVATRVAELRQQLRRLGVAGFLVPRADEHQNEYVPANAERLLWLTGFSGSAGLAIVLADSAALFIDGRYTEQVKLETDRSVFETRHIVDDPPTEWIRGHLKPRERLGYDPRLHTPDAVARFSKAAKDAGAELVPLAVNPIDEIWPERPAAPHGAITLHRSRYAGEGATAKLEPSPRRAKGRGRAHDQRSS